jgi:cyclopropane-fatty-acyl-phospholipid synthase
MLLRGQTNSKIGSGEGWSESHLRRWLAAADVDVGGARPWDIRVNDPRFYHRVIARGSLGLGEAWMDGWWDCQRLDAFFLRVFRAGVHARVERWTSLWPRFFGALLNLQGGARAWEVGQRHYDAGDDLFERMLDRRMLYSCAYWRSAEDLDVAQEAKLDLVFDKLGLQPGMRTLDIGCGWGGAARYAAERRGVEVVGVTVSTNQARRAEKVCAGLPVSIFLADYRELPRRAPGPYDRIWSIGMFEHVGLKNYRRFLRLVADLLTEDGAFLLHSIGRNTAVNHNDPWIQKYVFPNSLIPAASQLTSAYEPFFVMEDWHNLGIHYDRTLMAWHRRAEAAWPKLSDRYDERFRRMWRFYLLASAGAFRARQLQLWQLLLSRRGLREGFSRQGAF